ncbi:MAG TPA: PEPxxWA-CTERM sorting domain-containing protein [Rhizomicrobium sp.]|nr:PEPxxWA-CTERM sorting domain-containing protein [Rhizomicrobium sp.]
MKSRILLIGAALAAVSGGFANAASNNPPPAGAILDLNGTPITNVQQLYTVNFAAALSNTAITFAFRQDPSFSSFSGASVVDLTTSSGNLLINGDFSGGTYTNNGNASTPNGWTYANIYGAIDGGEIDSGCGVSGSHCWYDGAVQAYDAISQSIATTIGDTYRISFNFSGGGCDDAACLYSDLSTNGDTTDTGGNGIDMLVYAQAGLPAAGGVPEPATWAMFLLGFGAIGWTLRSRRNQSAATA